MCTVDRTLGETPGRFQGRPRQHRTGQGIFERTFICSDRHIVQNGWSIVLVSVLVAGMGLILNQKGDGTVICDIEVEVGNRELGLPTNLL